MDEGVNTFVWFTQLANNHQKTTTYLCLPELTCPWVDVINPPPLPSAVHGGAARQTLQ